MTPISDRAQAAYATLRGLAATRLPNAERSGETSDGFTEALTQAAKGMRNHLLRAEQTAMASLGGTADAQSMVEAVAKAELALQTASVVRDRVVQAYQDILRMPI